jgi:hypothetical protein
VDGLQPAVGEQSPDEPGLEDEAHSRVEPLQRDAARSPGVALLAEAAPVAAVHSQAEAGSPVRSVDAACFAAEPRSLPDEAYSPDEAHSRSVGAPRHCAATMMECCAPQCRVEERCLLDVEPAYWPLAELRYD